MPKPLDFHFHNFKMTMHVTQLISNLSISEARTHGGVNALCSASKGQAQGFMQATTGNTYTLKIVVCPDEEQLCVLIVQKAWLLQSHKFTMSADKKILSASHASACKHDNFSASEQTITLMVMPKA